MVEFPPSEASIELALAKLNLCPRTAPSLPTELCRQIVLGAWISASQTFSRWAVYRSMCLVSKSWYHLAAEAAIQFVLIREKHDMERYQQFVNAHVSSLGEQTAPQPTLFSSSEAYLYITGRHIFCSPEHPREGSRTPSSSVCVDLNTLLPDARSLHLFVINDSHVMHILRTPRPSLKSLTVWYDQRSSLMLERSYFTCLSLTHLHILGAPTDLEKILLCFPNLTHLRLSTATFLKEIASSTPKLECITIDVPPASITGEDYTSLSRWNLPAALNRGLLSQGDSSVGRTIIINTGGDKPTGWDSAHAACLLRGITMLHNIVYDEPTPLWINGTYDQIFNDPESKSLHYSSPCLPPLLLS
ncbi:hypothetical protein FIBSPDRAFT_950394 [Athelia psychrophila]|uniref:F-box domain-containing protein n=1 Tax=Athelia psychrophila TaxID=1759441 RepID=A0A166NTU3_9AGAM|nr:hypothetical protein FIBSPDRAFT_950394 [Fibularhizoctonia sp. CBS 109695]